LKFACGADAAGGITRPADTAASASAAPRTTAGQCPQDPAQAALTPPPPCGVRARP
jgi:hypothetical protein